MTPRPPKNNNIEKKLSNLGIELDKERRRVDEYIKKRATEESKLISLVKKTQSELSDEYKKSQQLKEDILSYTIQIVGIIVGIFAIILAITFLGINGMGIGDDFIGFFVAIVKFFVILAILFFVLWVYKNFFRK